MSDVQKAYEQAIWWLKSWRPRDAKAVMAFVELAQRQAWEAARAGAHYSDGPIEHDWTDFDDWLKSRQAPSNR